MKHFVSTRASGMAETTAQARKSRRKNGGSSHELCESAARSSTPFCKNSILSRFIIIALALGVLSTESTAQFRFGGQMAAMYDDNVNNNYLQISDQITQFALQAAHDWRSEVRTTQAFYTGSLNYFDNLSERTFHYHSLGLVHSRSLGQGQTTTLNAGATYNLRRNREAYAFYNHRQFSAYANLKHHLTQYWLGRLSYSLRYFNFAELPEFNYVEHYAFAQLTATLTTKTTIILESDLGSKIYTTTSFDELTSMRGHYGHGGSRNTSSQPQVTQFIGIARIGQNLVDGTGLSVTAQYQFNLQKEGRYLSYEDGVISDDELFDDHYGYEGTHVSVMLTQLLPAGMVLKVTGSSQERNFSERPAYDLAGIQVAAERRDNRKQLSAQFVKPFKPLGVSLGLGYDYIRNTSNDHYYGFANHAVTVQLSFAN